MKIIQSLLFMLFLLPPGMQAEVFDQIRSYRMGIALSNSSIFSDSSFIATSDRYFKAGTLLTVIGETKMEHEDNAQKQLFKWYKVKSNDGRKGWVYGESMLIKENENFIPKTLQAFNYRKYAFNSGFENSMIWFGSIVGRDNFGSKMMANAYEESYVIITNDQGKSVYIPISSSSQFGESEVSLFSIQELTGDRFPDFVLQTKIKDLENNSDLDLVQLFTFQAGTMIKIFEESLNVDSNSKSLKHLIFEKQRIRGYYFDHKKRTPQIYSFTYFWNKQSKRFDLLYPESPSIIRAISNSNGVQLKNSPYTTGRTVSSMRKDTQLRILKIIQKGNSLQNTFAEIRTNEGKKGYVQLKYLMLKDFKNVNWVYANLRSQNSTDQSFACIELPEIHQDTTSIQR